MDDLSKHQGPTIANGPLSDRPDTLDDRLISAQFADEAAARAARGKLLAAGVAEGAITIVAHAADSAAMHAQVKPADDTLLGRVREAILPDEATVGARAAIANDDAVLTVVPTRDQVETVVQIIAASAPTRFDADLERWRNKG